MYAIYGNIYHQYTPNVSICTIHGSYGILKLPFPICSGCSPPGGTWRSEWPRASAASWLRPGCWSSRASTPGDERKTAVKHGVKRLEQGVEIWRLYIYTVCRFWMVLTCFERRRGVWPNKNELMGTFSQEILWVFILQTYWFKPLTFPVHISLNHRKTLVALVLTQTWCRVGTRWERIEANSWKINCWIGWIVWNVLSLTKSTLW